ncbi:Phage related protein [Moraxella catarrhalis]|uniref:phage head closure protein n=1 Tax=Moraxella catarrhalis TaxID=480 RepID=UPI0007E6111F|nr:phage head closure protein [Moraxella catarrhalis]OAV36031.1 Phage related protein [Moraxella catarrhalis]
MRASQLRYSIKVHQKTISRSATGAVTSKWAHILTLSAQFTPLSVKDVITGQAAGTDITARAIIRYRTDIDHTMRVQYAGRMYEIVGEPLADNKSGKEYLTLMLKGVADDRKN